MWWPSTAFEDDDDVAKLVIGIAAKNDEHIQVITTITNALDEPEAIEKWPAACWTMTPAGAANTTSACNSFRNAST